MDETDISRLAQKINIKTPRNSLLLKLFTNEELRLIQSYYDVQEKLSVYLFYQEFYNKTPVTNYRCLNCKIELPQKRCQTKHNNFCQLKCVGQYNSGPLEKEKLKIRSDKQRLTKRKNKNINTNKLNNIKQCLQDPPFITTAEAHKLQKEINICYSSFCKYAKQQGITFKGNTNQITETKLFEYIKSFNLECFQNKRFYYSGKKFKTLDIYIPSINLGIEFNGDYWHSIQSKNFQNDKIDYHYNKKCYFESIGINVLFFTETEVKKYFNQVNEIILQYIENRDIDYSICTDLFTEDVKTDLRFNKIKFSIQEPTLIKNGRYSFYNAGYNINEKN